jgi:MbtH protein
MFDDDDIQFKVVANHQEQYSIWPEFKKIPAGWIAVGPEGHREECLQYVEKIWTDMRPKTLRDKMKKEQEDAPTASEAIQSAAEAVLEENRSRVDEYGAGKPELYGWFVARVIDAKPDADPDEVRAALDSLLPAHNIPENYA